MRSGSTNDLFTLPSTVKRIDSFAFASGGYLREVVLNEGLSSIGFCAFTLCHRLYNVTLPSTLVDIGVGAFEGCHSLRKMTLLGNLDLKINRRIFDCHQSLRFEYPDIAITSTSSPGENVLPQSRPWILTRRCVFSAISLMIFTPASSVRPQPKLLGTASADVHASIVSGCRVGTD